MIRQLLSYMPQNCEEKPADLAYTIEEELDQSWVG